MTKKSPQKGSTSADNQQKPSQTPVKPSSASAGDKKDPKKTAKVEELVLYILNPTLSPTLF